MKNFLLLLFALPALCFAAKTTNKKLYICDRKIPCAGTFECMQVKEKTKEAWRVYTDTIAGFNYEEGYNYTILVAVAEAKNPYEGRLNDKYRLVKIISKTKTAYNPGSKLEGRKWLLISINDGSKKMTFNRDSAMWMQLNLKEGKLTARGICNGITGTVTVQNSEIRITNIASTKMLCAGQGSKLEAIYREFLAKPATYEIEGDTLHLNAADGSVMVFVAQ